MSPDATIAACLGAAAVPLAYWFIPKYPESSGPTPRLVELLLALVLGSWISLAYLIRYSDQETIDAATAITICLMLVFLYLHALLKLLGYERSYRPLKGLDFRIRREQYPIVFFCIAIVELLLAVGGFLAIPIVGPF